MKFRKVIIAASMVLSIPAWAQHMPGIERHQAKQQNRIAQGQASGQLTAQEAANLQRGQANIANQKAAAMADGKVTHAERAQIRQAQRQESQRIYNKKHN